MSHAPRRLNRRAGSVLVLVILAIVFLGALAAGVVSFLGTANMDTAVSNLAEKVYYNAESGFRYLASRYNAQGDSNGNGFADDDKAGVLMALDGSRVNLPGNLGSFTLDVHPYWFIATTTQTATNTITVRFPGTMPPGYSLPASGVLEVEGNSLHAYTSRQVNAPNVTFTLSDTVTLPSGYSVYLTLAPNGAQSVAKGGSLTLSTTSGSIFPDRNGQIEANGVAATYATATHNSATNVLTLSSLSAAVSVGAADRVILKKSAWVTSTGQAGSGGFATASDVEYNITLSDDVPGTGSEIDYSEEGGSYEMGGENPFTPLEGGGWSSGTYIDGGGSTQEYVTTDNVQNSLDPQSTCNRQSYIRYANGGLENYSLFSGHWENASNHLLSYDVQAKIAWGVDLDYAVGGISFRLHTSATAGKYNYLGLSFIRYKDADSCNVNRNNRDLIPDTIKPTTAAGGSLDRRCLLVLWEQEVVNGSERRKWIAYKDLSGERCIRGNQWSGDGQCVTDNSAMMFRSLELQVNGTKTSDISVYFGDASYSSTCRSRTPDAIPYNTETHRQAYYLNSTYPVGTSPFPTFPPAKLSNWNSTLDYYTFLETGGGSPAPCALCTWDRVNPAATGYSVQSDGGTLRTAKFVTPSSGSYPANRLELGLHQFNGGSGNNVITFRDYSFQFLIPKAGSSGSVASAVQR